MMVGCHCMWLVCAQAVLGSHSVVGEALAIQAQDQYGTTPLDGPQQPWVGKEADLATARWLEESTNRMQQASRCSLSLLHGEPRRACQLRTTNV